MSKIIQAKLPGALLSAGWLLPKQLSRTEWLQCGEFLQQAEGAVQWWLGDWWCHGERNWGAGEEIAEEIGVDYGTIRTYGSVARAFELSARIDNLTFAHHRFVMTVEGLSARLKWLRRAEKNGWSAQKLRAQIARHKAIEHTRQIDLDAKKLGRFAVLYADPPWQYEYPPMGGSNRSVENHYPTMMLEEICALPIQEVMHEDAVMFLWATSPKLKECMKVLEAWDLDCRSTAVWVKDKIGMGYYFREQHELILIARRGKMPPPDESNRSSSVIEAPRLKHSAKPEIVRDMLDQMYPGIRKIELFSRETKARRLWTFWGNQSPERREAAE
jgi:N6-adenosine-specific RNA methylase IME4